MLDDSPTTITLPDGSTCETVARCAHCGGSLWKAPGSDRWVCALCDAETRVACPKIRKHLAAERPSP